MQFSLKDFNKMLFFCNENEMILGMKFSLL